MAGNGVHEIRDEAVSVGELRDHTAYDDRRDEVGQIGNGLNRSLEDLILDFIQQDCENNRDRETENQIVDTDEQRIAHQTREIEAAEELREILQADKLTSHDTLDRLIVLEGDDVAVHRPIAEQDEVNRQNQQERVYQRMTANIHRKPLEKRLLFGVKRGQAHWFSLAPFVADY
jgi:L-fucose mutarotase/ribose pyranase (RbsD/FucU family)